MKKKTWLFVGFVVLVWLIADVTLWFNQQVPLANRLYRAVSGAPAVHLNGQLLMYGGKSQAQDNEVVFYKNSDEADKLYKAQGIPDAQVPPYFYVRGAGDTVYQYATPHSPFGMR